jgi:capsular exopolysaccharide synthesis family protein
MSLIQSAVEKAKKLADTVARRPLSASPEVVTSPGRERRMQSFNEDAIEARAMQARVLPVATVDAEAMERHCVLLQVNDQAAQSAYRILRTRIQMQMLARDWHSMAVTAAGSSEGKSTTAINIAISLARDISTWVYLVDLDLQRPKLATYLGLRFDKGLSDYLAGSAEFQDILYNPGVERLVVVPNAQPMENSSDLLGSPRMSKLCQLLASEVPRPIVIFDLPPLFMSDDVLKFQQNADCTLLVVSEGITSRKMLERANEMLQKMNLIGVVLNRSSEREDSGYY